MIIKILFLIIVLLQLTVCAVPFFQYKRQKAAATHFPAAALLWGIAVCVNLLCLLYLRDLLKYNMVEYDIPNDEINVYKHLLAGFGILLLMQITYLFLQYSKHINRGKWMRYLRYFTYIVLTAALVTLFVKMIDVYKVTFILCIFEANIFAIVSDVIESVKFSEGKG